MGGAGGRGGATPTSWRCATTPARSSGARHPRRRPRHRRRPGPRRARRALPPLPRRSRASGRAGPDDGDRSGDRDRSGDGEVSGDRALFRRRRGFQTATARAFVRVTNLVHRWRQFPGEDPGLPAELPPAAWPGAHAAGALHAFCHRDRSAAARRW
ncbi:MAG: PaaX family transcriptional regulator C-terminal domain-containing protein [Acidimicrobiales bacterium]